MKRLSFGGKLPHSRRVAEGTSRINWREIAAVYRWDALALCVICVSVLLFLAPLWAPGYIVFSDLDFGIDSRRYLNEIFGVWNERWSTPTLLNIARLPWIIGPWLLSGIFGWSGAVFLKSFITSLLLVSAASMYWLCKRITSVYFSRHFDFITIFGLVGGALYYALNPWVIFRIQHVFLLCGYSLMPLCLSFFFNAFDPRFQRQFIAGYEPGAVKLYRRQVFDLFCFALCFSISAGAIHYFFYGAIFYTGIGVLLLLNTLRLEKGGWRLRWGILKVTALKLGVVSLLFGCFSAFWLGTYVSSILKHAEVSQHNVNVVDTFSLFSRNSSPVNVLYLISYWWPMFDLHSLPWTFWAGGGVLLGVIAICVLTRSWRHPILFLFTVLSAFFALAGTGVQLESFANIFVLIVTKTPVIGPIFRDPNKAVGLMAIGFSILLTFGTQLVIRWLAPPRGHRWQQGVAVATVLAGLWFYVIPMRKPFIEGFYHPVKVPAEYFRVQSQMIDPDRFDSRVLYMPIADAMTQPETGIATPFWNRNPNPGGMVKATGDFQVYSSRKNALFQHEGNSPQVGYYFSFLQDLMDHGATRRLGRLMGPLGVNELAYRKEYLGQEKRQQFNLEILRLQQDISPRRQDGIFNLFRIDRPLPYLSVIPRRIFSPYGLTSLESYGAFPNFNFRDNGVVFSGWEKGGGLGVAKPGDLFDVRQLDDLALTTLSKDDYILPFDAVEDGDPFLKWSKTLLANPDWEWSLRSQGLNGFAYEADLNAGVVLTFASRRLNLRPYQMTRAQKTAPIVVNFEQVLRQDKMFVADAPEKVTVQSYPGGPYNQLPLVHGMVASEEPKNIWQVAKSGYFDARPDNPYQFRVVASGRGTNKLHIKARFFDKNHNEIGAQYVVAPSEKIDFDAVNMFGECVSPPGARWMRLDLLTLPRKGERVYWWIHDIEIRSLAKWAVPNVIRTTKNLPVAEKAEVFVRVLLNARGGLLRFGFGQWHCDVNTRDATQTQFVWKRLGVCSFPAGKLPVTIESLGGFNAVNIIALVPVQRLASAREETRRVVSKGRAFCPLQAETDFQRQGPIQSERFYPTLAMGRGFAAPRGRLSRPLEIINPGPYTAAVWLATGSGQGEITVSLRSEKGKTTRRIWKARAAHRGAQWVVEQDENDKIFPRRLMRLPGLLNNYQRVDFPLGQLRSGKYTLNIDINSRVPSIMALHDLHLFNPQEIKVDSDGLAEVEDSACANCVSLTNDMMKNEFQARTGTFRMNCQPTCSCQWYINSSNMLPADERSEYLISFRARSQNVRRRHTKVFCLDKNRVPLDTVYINEVEESEQGHWNLYQQIVLTPPGTRYLQFHVWARGGEHLAGSVELKDLSFVPVKKLMTVDQVALVQGNEISSVFATLPTPPKVEFGRSDSMQRWFQIDGPATPNQLVRFSESPSPLWEMDLNGERSRSAVAINGVSNGFVTSNSGKGVVKTVLRGIYVVSLLLSWFGFFIAFLLWKVSIRHQAPEG